MSISRGPANASSSAAYLNHDHRERKNVRLLAVCPRFVQDLWRRPSCGLIVEEVPFESRVLRHHGETKIRDPGPAKAVHKDVRLHERETDRNAN